MWSQCESREEERARHMSKGSGYLFYEIVDRLYDYCFPILNKISHKLEWIEDQIFEGKSDEVVRDISNAKQEIINYRKIIKPSGRRSAVSSAPLSATRRRTSRSTSMTSSTRTSGSGTSSRTPRRSSTRWMRPASR